MTEKHPPPSTQTAFSTTSLPPLNPLSPTPLPKAFASQYAPLPTFPSAVAPFSDSSATNTSLSPTHNGTPTPKGEPAAEEEPYTIKCICGFTGDDGNTILCEICDSWQHIECFYPNNSEEATREEFAHACHECKPRPLNVAHAIEYQKKRLQVANAEAASHPKPKRPPSKSHGQSHKKKAKPNDLQINGHSSSASDVARHDGNGHPTAKKSKSSHKSSQSVGGSHTKRSPSYSASRASLQHVHPLSPATTPPDVPEGELYGYSSDFLNLCSDQDSAQTVHTNSFASLAVSNTTSIWLREPEKMLRDAGQKFEDIFQQLPSNIDSIQRPPRIDVKKRILEKDAVVRWKYLAASAAVGKDVPLMELNGQIGFQKDYCAIPANRYEELSCPLPFVFFHPQLPLYIDTRREGSLARYVRRSCRPNAVLDTFLSGGTEYHFWLVSDKPIDADEQITIPWEFMLPSDAKARVFRLLGLSDDDSANQEEFEVPEDEYTNIARWVSAVLSRYGGCACDLGPECGFARFHRLYSGKLQHARNHNKKKSSRKSKSQALSPTSTGHATNSRAASEGHAEDLHEDKMSTSSRSKPPSRDMTPAPRQGSFDTLGILTEPTDRDKRKVAMVEDSFRRLEQQQPKKKKRVSDGTSTTEKSSASAGHSKSKTKSSAHESINGTMNSNYVDAETSRSKSGSPVSTTSPNTMSLGGFTSLSAAVGSSTYSVSRHTSACPSLGYRDAESQTDPTEGEWYNENPPTPRPKRRVISLSRRLLNHRFRSRCEGAEPMPPVPAKMDVDTIHNPDQQDNKAAVAVNAQATNGPNEDVAMTDAPDAAAPTDIITAKIEPVDNGGSGIDVPIKRSPDLRVQLPKVPSFSDANPTSATTPLTGSSMVQSPFAVNSANPFGSPVATPSPIKKKMSLSDYTKSRKAARPPTTLKPSLSEESKAEGAAPAEGESAAPAVAAPPTTSST
ncbi:SET domain-containing protein 3 [Sporothrix eucalyptigena]